MVRQMMDSVMVAVHDQSLPTIGLLQESFPHRSSFMIGVSTLFDPRYVFLVYAPLLFALNRRVGHRMLTALTWAEWANQILKWLLAGERPYWYVHERAHQLANATAGQPQLEPAQLKQFPVTCELGAGSPSGHSMVTATVWYILIDAYLRGELQLLGRASYAGAGRTTAAASAKPADLLARLAWAVYTLMLLLVGLSRVYLACHFPHQCLAGALLGCLMARFVAERVPMEALRRRHFALATGFQFASALATYAALRLTGFDPLWSVDKAMRWCANKDYIHLDTTPFFSMMRYLGFCFGAGLAYDGARLASSGSRDQPAPATGGQAAALLARRLLAAGAAIAFGQLLLAAPLPRSIPALFYASSFAIYALFAYAIAGPIPQLAKQVWPASRRTGRQIKAN